MRRVLVVLLLLAAGCSSGSDTATPRASSTAVTPSASAPTPEPGPTTPSPAAPTEEPPLGAEGTHFATPTGNIDCIVSSDSVRCDISQRTWTPPPKPAACGADWGSVVELTAKDAPAAYLCAGDTAPGAARVVPYGGAVRVGDLQCVVLQQGVECTHEGSSHGFLLSRTKVRLT